MACTKGVVITKNQICLPKGISAPKRNVALRIEEQQKQPVVVRKRHEGLERIKEAYNLRCKK